MLLQPVISTFHINRVFLKVLSSQSFSKGKQVGFEIQYGRQNITPFVLSCHCSKICQKDSPHQNVFKLTLSQKSLYVFRKDRECKFIFLLSPSLDLINIISIKALEAMKVASKTWQRSRRISPAAGSYLQPCINHTFRAQKQVLP